MPTVQRPLCANEEKAQGEGCRHQLAGKACIADLTDTAATRSQQNLHLQSIRSIDINTAGPGGHLYVYRVEHRQTLAFTLIMACRMLGPDPAAMLQYLDQGSHG